MNSAALLLELIKWLKPVLAPGAGRAGKAGRGLAWQGWLLGQVGQARQARVGRAGWGLAWLGRTGSMAGRAGLVSTRVRGMVTATRAVTVFSRVEIEANRIKLGVMKKQKELGLLGSIKGRIQLVVLMNLHLKFRNKERTKEIQDLSQSLYMTNDDSRENRREPTRQ
ncbi:hypothetical protein BY996DRAFT_6578566 [Phakopsora pachyrhizi]|nr:hypothetical protein BY996DRAFT_6578566 [Phakopsora pachyrhizi]